MIFCAYQVLEIVVTYFNTIQFWKQILLTPAVYFFNSELLGGFTKLWIFRPGNLQILQNQWNQWNQWNLYFSSSKKKDWKSNKKTVTLFESSFTSLEKIVLKEEYIFYCPWHSTSHSEPL